MGSTIRSNMRCSNQPDMIAGSNTKASKLRTLLPAHQVQVSNKEPREEDLTVQMAMMTTKTRGRDPSSRNMLQHHHHR
jgi:hypothetical protein